MPGGDTSNTDAFLSGYCVINVVMIGALTEADRGERSKANKRLTIRCCKNEQDRH